MIWSLLPILLVLGVVEALNVRALIRSFTHGVAVLRGGSVSRAESPRMFKVYVAMQIATVVVLAGLMVFATVSFLFVIPTHG